MADNNLSRDVLTTAFKNANMEFPQYNEKYFWETWLPSILSEREYKIVCERHIGIDKTWNDETAAQSTMRDVAKHHKVTFERIRQILEYAYRRIKHPANFKKLIDNTEDVATKLFALKTRTEQLKNTADDDALSVLNKIEIILNAVAETQNANPNNIKIDSFDWSVRTYNVLTRTNIKTVNDIVELGEEGLKKVKNLGRHSLQEIKDTLNTMNINIA